jgi:polysaccharide biosynthesis transport protein
LNVSTDNAIGTDNGHGGPPGRLLPAGRPGRFTGIIRPAPGYGTQLADLTALEAGTEQASAGSWPRFLLKYACWILLVTAAALAGAHLLLHTQTRIYRAQASVEVQPPATQVGSLQAPNMATEKGIVSSGAVLTIASRTLRVPTAQLLNGVSANSPGNTYLLTISYSSPNPYTAQQRAEAIAQAYVTYRTPKPAPQSKGKKITSPAVSTTPTATLITSASLPPTPSSPKPALDYGIAVLVGLSLGIGTAAIRDRINDRVRGPADLEACAGAPLLALVPAFWPTRRKPAARLIMLGRPRSVVADAYRGLRTRIVQAAPSGPSTLTVTCPAREDKDAVAANLAVALAQSGRTAVLVCADLRWGRAHRFFGLEETSGLSGLLDRRTNLDKELVATSIPGLQVLPAGPPPLDTGAMLQRPAFRTLLGALRDRADFVVIAAPPVLASADAGLLADYADVILFVADARRSARAQVRTAMRELTPGQDDIVGCVLTGAGIRRLLWRSPVPVPAKARVAVPPAKDKAAEEPPPAPPVTPDTPEIPKE